jgi:broad specificity phosphatase PhoE
MFNSIFAGEFYFARHGETDFNLQGNVSGDMDVPLSATGVAQSFAVAELVLKLRIASAFCSPLVRALETARNMLSGTGIVPTVIEDLRERHWGELQGVSKKNLDDYDFSKHGVEDWEVFSRRTVSALNAVTAAPPVLIVAHSGTYRVLVDHLMIEAEKKQVRNAYPYRFYKTGGVWQVSEVK